MENQHLFRVFRILRDHRDRVGSASVTEISENHKNDPYRVLISCLISLRTKDEVTEAASARLFDLADTPSKMIKLPEAAIAKAIYPAGFYRTKAATILLVSRDILGRFQGKVPDEIDNLLTLKGVGRKTANLVVTLGFGKPGICVDTHVHRIVNRWGLLSAPDPGATEASLRKVLPRRYWIPINDLLVTYGRTVCKPISPHCTQCEIREFCDQAGVSRFR
ncbi:MAG: endonuclease III [Candidatus Omnitrophica bacterium]|nr:endonuclease III [Candidatus Omnitrophota bacterium]